MAPAPRPWAERGSQEFELQAQGHVAWVDNVVPFDDVPIRYGAVAFTDFLLMPENIAAGSNYARHGSGLSGVARMSIPCPRVCRRPPVRPRQGQPCSLKSVTKPPGPSMV